MRSSKKMEVLLPEAGRMDVGQEKQQMSPSAAEPFGQVKSYWEARHANQIISGDALGMPACRRVCSEEPFLPERTCAFSMLHFCKHRTPTW